MKIITYKVRQENDEKLVAVVAPNTTYAQEMIKQRYPNHSIHFKGICDEILQIQGQFNTVVADNDVAVQS